MCCRYYYNASDEPLRQMAELTRQSPLLDRFEQQASRAFMGGGEMAPGMIVPAAASNKAREQAIFPMQWGYRVEGEPRRAGGARPNFWLFNARTETAAEKPAFRESWEKHRCALPASCYFEWEHFIRPNGKADTGQKYAFRPSGGGLLWLAGLYRLENGLPRFVVLTREPTEAIRAIHDRMPLVLAERDVAEWIHPDGDPWDIAKRAVTEMTMQKAV